MARKSVRSLLLTALLATPLLSYATQYPLTVTDLDGRQVTLAKEPQRIILQDGRDIMTLALLDRDNPFKRLVAWNNLAKKQDVATWQMLKTTWPQSATILDMGFSDKGNVDLESVIARQPDLMIAQLRARPALMESGVIDKLSALHVPVLFVDYEIAPAKDTAPSIDLLGKVLNRESQAKAFTDYYRQQLQTIRQKTAAITPKANVFVEALAGNSDACCFTHGHSGWGGLVEAVGANNIGSQLLPGASGFVSLEKIISMKPDAWIMTGSKRGNSQVLPLGYAVKPEAVKAQAQTLLARPGVSQIPAVQEKRAYGVYHHFYNHPWNIVGMKTWRKISTRRPSAISTRMRRTIILCAISPTCRTSRSSSPGSRASKYSMRLTSDSVLDGLPAGTSGMMNDYRRIVRRRLLLILLLTLLIVASLLLDFMLGPSGLPLQSLWQTLTDPASADPGTRAIVWDIRLPYAVMAIIVGLALGLAGAEMQTILNNPLASPFTLGVSSAAAFGAALAIVLGIGLPGIPGQWFISANAFIFALLAALLLDGISRWTQVATSGVILFGIALVFTFNALVSMLQFIANEDTLQGLVFWTMGSIDRASWSKVAILLVALALVMPLSLRSAWKLTALRLGEDRAISFGINVRRLRLTTLLRISILSALSVAFVGPIGFIGLVAPHIARMLFGEDHRFYLPASALIGALVLSLASIASKNLIPGAIIPVGIVTSLVGVPFFLSIILRHRGQV